MEVPRGWLLAYCLVGFAVSAGLAYQAIRDQSVIAAIESVGFLTVAVLLWCRSRWALLANALLGLFVIGVGIFVYWRIGRPGLLFGGVCILASYWTFREELADDPIAKRREMGYGMGMSFDELLAEDDDFNLANGVFGLIDQPYYGCFDASQYREVELPIMLVWHAKGIIGNGGFEYLFEGPWQGDSDYSKTVAAHAAIGHAGGHKAFVNALSAFPDGLPPQDEEEKHSIYMTMPESQRSENNRLYWGERDEHVVEGLLADYIRSNADGLAHLRGRIS